MRTVAFRAAFIATKHASHVGHAGETRQNLGPPMLQDQFGYEICVGQFKNNNSKITLKEVQKALKIRDYMDINRKHSPLRVTKDSVVIDTSKLNIKQTLSKISKIVEKKLLLKYGRNFKTK